MRIIITAFSFFFITSCAKGKETSFIGSTPAAKSIRSFLGIAISDSIDFIRWKITLRDNAYQLECNYGISKPNTNGFINGGGKINLQGVLKKEKNYFHLQNGNKTLNIVELNENLLHLLDEGNSLLVGNGGWSYTLNNTVPTLSSQLSINARPITLKDSMAFEGRTPCNIPGIIEPGKECYKIKWYIVLYANTEKKEPATFKILGTAWRKAGGRTGTWKIIPGKNNRIIYQLNDEKGNGFLYLLKLDDNILVFTDEGEKLLVGDEDFSYTLNRRR